MIASPVSVATVAEVAVAHAQNLAPEVLQKDKSVGVATATAATTATHVKRHAKSCNHCANFSGRAVGCLLGYPVVDPFAERLCDQYDDGTNHSTTAAPEPQRVQPFGTTTCSSCKHFSRISDHPHLGHCAAGEVEEISGLWDTDRRTCAQHREA